MKCSITMKSIAVRLVNMGYAVYGIDYEGHGKSEGLLGFVNDDVDDCSEHFTSICGKFSEEENRGKTRFLLGVNGSFIAYEETRVLGRSSLLPCVRRHEAAPGLDLCPNATVQTYSNYPNSRHHRPDVTAQVRANPYCYIGKPRLKTGYECLRISVDLEERMSKVMIPFITLHREEDRVTDKSVSKQLYSVGSSSDKTFVVYPGMWHGLLCLSGNSSLEKELKNDNDVPSK
ncbi:hypothetical protein MLD38_038126 [Melastoma candidum]|uniref:Uncharacterized protein n=1 Tax=Melastoma candidum TaxID=119954 RepID=A0ACB9KYJ6_9MYRT|nr:hypothetical protein MLD38_038126 [Melastoma candidum]